ncbi:MAG: hypothetical protein E6H07_13145 [Bacteroidetes bacterium]|nr:MAG: hypothetical protein E6H07_13145 [Bacteroidota bacterium]
MDKKFFHMPSGISLLKEFSSTTLVLFDSPITNLIMKNNDFHARCLTRKEEGVVKLKSKLNEARLTFFSKEDMANWLCKIQEDIKSETGRIYVRFQSGWESDESKINFEEVGYLLGMFQAAEEYLDTLTGAEPIGQNKAHYSVYDSLEKLDAEYLKTDNIPSYYRVQQDPQIKKHEFELKNLDDYWKDYLSLTEKHHVVDGFGDKSYLLHKYHIEFASQLHKNRPRKDLKLMLDYHLKGYTGEKLNFVNHVEYRILPIIEQWSHSDYIVFRELVNEWIYDQRNLLSREDESFLVESFQDCCLTFLNNLAIHRPLNDENKYNSIIRDLLQQRIVTRSWIVSDQSLGGFSSTSSSASSAGLGERDLVLMNNTGQVISLIEFMRIASIPENVENDSKLKIHLLKLFRYETTGVSPLFIIFYCESKRFTSTWTKYCEYISKMDFGNYPLVKFQSQISTKVQRANVTLAVSQHKREFQLINVYHIFVNMFP